MPKYSTDGSAISDCGCQGGQSQGVSDWQDDLFGVAKNAATDYANGFAPGNNLPIKLTPEEQAKLDQAQREAEEAIRRQTGQQQTQQAGFNPWLAAALAAAGVYMMSDNTLYAAGAGAGAYFLMNK